MAIRVECPSCGVRMNAPESMAGKRASCPKCKAVLLVPAGEPVPIGEPAPVALAETKDCPYCREPVALAAKKCKHCGEIIQEREKKYCHECGEVIRAKAEICTKCGVRQTTADYDEETPRTNRVAAGIP